MLVFTGCLKDKEDNKVITPTSEFTKKEKLQGYKIDLVENVKFVMAEELFKARVSTEAAIIAVNIAGSFNGWNATLEDWKMVKSTTEEVWTLEKVKSLVKIPGNSGHPEYKFVITTKKRWYNEDKSMDATSNRISGRI